MKRIESDCEEEIAEQNRDVADDNAVCCVAANTFCAARSVHSFVAGDGHDHDPKEKSLYCSIKNIETSDVKRHWIQVGSG